MQIMVYMEVLALTMVASTHPTKTEIETSPAYRSRAALHTGRNVQHIQASPEYQAFSQYVHV
jgi:hypothetical protein